ncbi:MAG: hypothetical protein GTO53_06845 [Planctomycetales bacterium]|nr:hypothetical protein [Planctomycetales bacterium]NIM08853.1 hypothetical protein [Planctomycetales bacterium]NIN08316.1 hypothetical protein [Planctomycetales bacterium]NIN77445.1 hypothetical protein [Planctomycetales bacterium]NIO34617.1 hypothetical protein [Planctomycetales bacterium]
MSVAVKVWISLLLAALAALTLVTLVRITADPRLRPVGTPEATTVQPPLEVGRQPLDLTSFQMTRRNGQSFSFAELQGKVWVASFFFSTCPHECMHLNQSLAALQRDETFDGVRFLSITVDPVTDTPEVLDDYAKLFNADADRWLFLNGQIAEVMRFGKSVGVSSGFKSHTRRLALVDKTGRVRGHFMYNEAAAMKEMSELAAQLVAEPSPPPPQT